MKKLALLIPFFLCVSFFTYSQNDNATVKKKEHYRIINNGADDPLWVQKAMVHANMDSLRYVNERRRIAVEGTSIIIELFSAQELLTAHQKPIHPQNIADASKAGKYKLRLENGMFIAVPVK